MAPIPVTAVQTLRLKTFESRAMLKILARVRACSYTTHSLNFRSSFKETMQLHNLASQFHKPSLSLSHQQQQMNKLFRIAVIFFFWWFGHFNCLPPVRRFLYYVVLTTNTHMQCITHIQPKRAPGRSSSRWRGWKWGWWSFYVPAESGRSCFVLF